MKMVRKRSRFHIGMRTIKTVVSVVIAMLIVESNVSPYSNLSVAMLGAIAAVQPSFRESVYTGMSQIVGSAVGLAIGILLLQLPSDHIVTTGISVVFVILLYNVLHITYSPSLPVLMVVILCTSEGIDPVIPWALGRLWDTTIGVAVGMFINTVFFPYDNSKQIRFTVESLDREVIIFLEELFDGDKILPHADKVRKKIASMERQMDIFTKQRLIGHIRRQKQEIEKFLICEQKARQLVARIELLSLMGVPGKLNEANRARLRASGAVIRDQRHLDDQPTERDIVTNYHVHQILTIRHELLEALGEEIRIAEGDN